MSRKMLDAEAKPMLTSQREENGADYSVLDDEIGISTTETEVCG